MAEIAGMDLGVDLPSFSFGGNLVYILLIILVFFLAGIGIWFYLNNKMFNRKVVVFENIAGKGWEVTHKDRARLIKVGDGGEEILYLRRAKVYRTAYGRKQGKNEYWFVIGQDGYWYNFTLGDFDAKMNMLDIEPVDRDMRYMHVAIRKNIKDRYNKPNFMEKYGTLVMNGVFLLLIMIGLYFLIDKIGGLVSQVDIAMKANAETMKVAERILGSVDSIKAGGSGILQA